MFLKLKVINAFALFSAIYANSILALESINNCPEFIQVKDKKIVEENGWSAAIHAHRRGNSE